LLPAKRNNLISQPGNYLLQFVALPQPLISQQLALANCLFGAPK